MNMNRSAWLVRTVALFSLLMPLGCLEFPGGGDDDDDDDDGQDDGSSNDDDNDSGSGSGAGDPGEGGSTGDPTTTGGGSCDTSVFTDAHWETPWGVGGEAIYYDVMIRSDGSYQRQHIVGGSLYCEHGTWAGLDCENLEFSPCNGAPYSMSWAYDGGYFYLQGVEFSYQEYGVFNCGETECD
jgi:hypothetical protein